MITSDSDIAAINAYLDKEAARLPLWLLNTVPKVKKAPVKAWKATKSFAKERYKKREANPELSPLRQHFQRNKPRYIDSAGVTVLHTVPAALSSAVLGADPLEDSTTTPYTQPGPGLGVAQGAAVGATGGGLASVLYGKLADRPDIQRDLILALTGGALGAASQLSKTASEKEAWAFIPAITGLTTKGVVTAASLLASLGYLGTSVHQTMADRKRHAEAMKKTNEVRDKYTDLTNSADKLRVGAGGALAGGTIGGVASNLYGRSTGKSNMRRDLLATLAGAGIGGYMGSQAVSSKGPEGQ